MALRVDVIAVVGSFLAGEQHVPSVVIVVVPLRPILARRGRSQRVEQPGGVVVVFQDEMHQAAVRFANAPTARLRSTRTEGVPGLTMA